MSARFDYVKYDEETASIQESFKTAFDSVANALESFPPGRAQSLALTKLEESYMWVGKMLRDAQIQRNGAAELHESRG